MSGESHSLEKPIWKLYEDEAYVVFDKPAGLLVIPTPKKEKNTLVHIVNFQYAAKETPQLHPCHRLDRETSGAILFAKGKRHQQLMMSLFAKRGVQKKYIAFVHGRLSQPKGSFKSAVRDIDHNKFRKQAQAKQALTHFKVIDERKSFSVVEVQPVTGRTNQIRIHFSKNKHPLVGDRKYAFARDYPLKFRRTALHALSLEWKHPIFHNNVKVVSNLPKDMEVFLERN